MRQTELFAGVFVLASAVVVGFQFALALGAPWGAYAMGGAFPGTFPPAMRVAAVVQAGMLALAAAVVLARAGLRPHSWARSARWLVWLVVTLNALSLVLNLITPSAAERWLWVPVAALMFGTSFGVALRTRQPSDV